MLRKANLNDIKYIYDLLQIYNKKGLLLARPLSKLYDHLRDFWVFEDTEKKKLLGCCALQFCWDNLAEIRSLAVDPAHIRQGVGKALTERAIQEAFYFNIKEIFVLTYVPDFFKKFGFSLINRNELPLKVWSDCVTCVNFPDCNENAMLKKL